ncbi:TetR/AcrR family transcriptional regulator [Cellvibrio fontiphilus]|uniref:TetR/AcrR family transcriptional regulator n=1 Tax=Cellvibrio fontiphilus TaxID=1815559 RepID=A0ABV7FGR0_9GAMM
MMNTSDTRTLLLETALNLIWNSNYNSVGVNEICKQAGVTKGSFYHHFESKAELFCEATSYHWDQIRQDLDCILSPINTPLEQLENWLQFIYINKLGDEKNAMPGCAMFNAGMQTGCEDARIIETLQLMTERGAKYNQALVRSLKDGNFLIDSADQDIEQVARLMQQYVQGAMSHARVTRNIDNIKRDLPAGIYRLIGLKPEFWFSTKPTWPCNKTL